MQHDVPIPADLFPIYAKDGGVGPGGWSKCFTAVAETAAACRQVGFEILEAGNTPYAST
jgi:hypothetical protein